LVFVCMYGVVGLCVWEWCLCIWFGSSVFGVLWCVVWCAGAYLVGELCFIRYWLVFRIVFVVLCCWIVNLDGAVL